MDSLAGADTMENQNLTGTADVKAENSMILLLPLLAIMHQLSDRLQCCSYPQNTVIHGR